jgi:NAD(P)-dependent dehydrogenase (short-subunit alcohol dehydrogenase family)
MLLNGKTAVVYGGAGSIGAAVAAGFAAAGATVHLAGRTPQTLEAVAGKLAAEGGTVRTARVDARDEAQVVAHLDAVVASDGAVDIVFNATASENVQGVPLTQMPVEDFVRPIEVWTRSQFLTSRTAARHMLRQGSGVILMLTAQPARMAFPLTGGFGVACAALEGLSRGLAAELSPHGIRTVVIRSAGSPDAEGVRLAIEANARGAGITPAQQRALVEGQTMLRRMPVLAEVASVATFLVSDAAGPMTAAVVNLTGGAIAD